MDDPTNTYTATTAFLETLTLAGIEHVFMNLGSDHPSFVEAIAISKARKGRKDAIPLPECIAVTHEFVALSAAQGYYQATGKMAALILHVDCGLLNAGGAIHNVFRARCPVLVFTGLSAFTCEGEMRGSRSEFINWVQDVHDQPGIVRNYSKFSYEIRTGRNIGQVTMRAAQIAMTEPKGPVYLFGAREVMEESLPLPPVPIRTEHWQPLAPPAMPPKDVKIVADILLKARRPLVITSWIGNDHSAAAELLKLCETLEIPVLDHSPFALNFPTKHRLYQGTHYSGGGQHPLLAEADVVLILDSDVPFIPMQNRPHPDATIIHIDADPLKTPMPLFYIPAQYRYAVSSAVALEQINDALPNAISALDDGSSSSGSTVREILAERKQRVQELYEKRSLALEKASTPAQGGSSGEPQPAAVALAALGKVLPEDTLLISEAISNYGIALEHLGFSDSRRYVTSGASSLGYGGGASVGAKIGIQAGFGRMGGETLVCCVTGDGSYMFSVPSTVQHFSSKLRAPTLTVILCNGGWKSPKLSALLVHPTGYASRTTTHELGVHFGPNRPDYIGLAVAAAGGPEFAWGKRIVSGSPSMREDFEEAVRVVKSGRSVTLEVIIPEL